MINLENRDVNPGNALFLQQQQQNNTIWDIPGKLYALPGRVNAYINDAINESYCPKTLSFAYGAFKCVTGMSLFNKLPLLQSCRAGTIKQTCYEIIHYYPSLPERINELQRDILQYCLTASIATNNRYVSMFFGTAVPQAIETANDVAQTIKEQFNRLINLYPVERIQQIKADILQHCLTISASISNRNVHQLLTRTIPEAISDTAITRLAIAAATKI